MAFDSETYLATWRDTGKFPEIHDELADLVDQTRAGQSVLDFCASTGILGQQLQDRLKLRVCAVEWLQDSIDRGRSYGVNVPTLQMRVLPARLEEPSLLDPAFEGDDPADTSLARFSAWIEHNQVTGIVARRCLSDVFGGTTEHGMWPEPDYAFARHWCETVIAAGVREVWLQGRAWSSKATHPIPCTNAEVACLASHFRSAERSRNCAYLVARPAPLDISPAELVRQARCP